MLNNPLMEFFITVSSILCSENLKVLVPKGKGLPPGTIVMFPLN